MRAGKKFIDPEFPPTALSCANPDIEPEKYHKMKQYEWMRITDIYPTPHLFQGGIETSDINQGELGDCYLLVVLGAAAYDQQAIEARFYHKELNSVGAILVKMFVNGKEQWILIDDYIPTKYGKPAFVSSIDEGEVWPCLLEKAWAKLHGTYARCEAGQPTNAALHIMGCPGESYENEKDWEKIWPKVEEGTKRDFTMFAATHNDGRDLCGCVPGHAY